MSRAVVWGVLLLAARAVPAAESGSSLLGSPSYLPTAEHPIGWRGDGSGRYPNAQPPTTWQRKQGQEKDATSNLTWMTPLPNTGVSSPIIVGDRIFLTCEPADLVCIDKKSGRLLWIRSIPEFEAVAKDIQSAEPAYAESLTPLSADLAKANVEVVEALNQEPATAQPAVRKPSAAQKRKRDIEKQIAQQQTKIDKKRFTHNWAQAVFGYTGATPTSDGRFVYAFLTTGVSVCYDLEGNRQWIAAGEGGGSEHGNFASPLLCDHRLIVWANELRAYDAQNGKLAWTTPAKAFNTYGSLFAATSGGESVACFQWGFFTRVRDGAAIWDKGAFGDSVTTPIVQGDTIYAWVGYPHNGKDKKGFKAFKVPADTHTGGLVPAYGFDTEWAEDEMPVDEKKNPFDRGFVASPLYVDGLLYQVNQGGGLLVNDAATGKQVYRKVLPLKPRTEYWNWAGCGASPTLAGKYIFLFDNQGTTIVLRPGRKYEEISRNVIEEPRENKEQAQNLATPIFEGTRMYYRTPGYLYCIGEK